MNNILFLPANPKNTTRLELSEEVNKINDAIKNSKYRDQFDLKQRHAINIGELQEKLLRFEPNIVHFSGHGSQESALVFEQDDDGIAKTTSPDALTNLFRIINQNNKIQCIILNACYSEEQAEAINRHVPCVIAISDRISDDDAVIFATNFYKALINGQSIKNSFELSLNELDLQNILEPDIPKLRHASGFDPTQMFLINPEENNRKKKNSVFETVAPTILDKLDATKSNIRFNNWSKKTRKPRLFRGEKPLFVGREIEIKKIRNQLVHSNQIVIITGEGGIGKTSLAFKAIHECEYHFDLIIPIYLNSNFSINDILLNIQRNIAGISENIFETYSLEKKKYTIIESLKNYPRTLIFIDNFDAIFIDKNKNNERLLKFLHDISLKTSLLLTSRTKKLELPNSVYINLNELDVYDGVKLFVKLVNPKLKNSLKDIKIIEDIIRLTGGYPLAIEILAGNYDGSDLEVFYQNIVKTITPRTIDKQEFSKSLFSMFLHTFSKLDKKLSDVLINLTIFRSPFLVDSACAMFEIKEKDIIKLHKQGFLRRIQSDEYGKFDNNFWFYYFHPLIREQLNQIIKEKDIDLTKDFGDKFAILYNMILDVIYKSFGKKGQSQSIRWFNLIMNEENNDFVRSLSITSNQDIISKNTKMLGLIFENLKQYSKALTYYEKSLEIHKSRNNIVEMQNDFNNIGRIHLSFNNFDESLAYYEKALAISKEIEDKPNLALSYNNIGNIYQSRGNYEEAVTYYEKALAISENTKSKKVLALSYNNIGNIYQSRGNYEEAVTYYEKALAISKEINDEVSMSRNYNHIGTVLQNMGKLNESLEHHKKAIAISEKFNDSSNLSIGYTNLGKALFNMGKLQESLQMHMRSLAIDEATNNRIYMMSDYTNIGRIFQYLARYDEALSYFEKALAISKEINDEVSMSRNYNHIGTVLQNMGKLNESLEHHKKSLTINEEIGDKISLSRDYNNMGSVFQSLRKPEESLEYYKKSLTISQKIKDKYQIASRHYNISLVLLDMNRFKEALKYSQKALEINRELNNLEGMIRCAVLISIINIQTKNPEATSSVLYAKDLLERWKDEKGFTHSSASTIEAILSEMKT